ncbi:uncharacterized protein LOC123692489 [Colias croceus]|uniref:uncharacterized protein LOC123692489 n=1 Tax=Colias crocea TaxID=72248 RepID=UPI001E27BADB|nr:uncharacterized protein LOC123692489 [Colias croceus]
MANTSSERNRCINCSFLIPRNMKRHHLEEASNLMLSLLRSWIAPTQVSSENIICNECFELLQNRANTTSEGSILPLSAFGHRRVCLPCGNSILRSRTYPVRHDREERNVLIRFVPQHLVSRMERVCAACWRSATREVQRQQQRDSNRPTLADTELSGDSVVPVPPPLPPTTPQIVQPVTTKIISSMYRRAANTPGHCIFVGCFEPERLLIPSTIKDLVLFNHKFYIPSGARICRHHLNHGSWDQLTSQLRDFTGRQFDNIMTMMQRAANHRFDFSNIALMPPHLFHYWLGMNLEQFYELLNCIPNLAEQVPDATLALCIYLVKLRTGDSNNRLATLFNKPRATLEHLMNKARNCFIND